MAEDTLQAEYGHAAADSYITVEAADTWIRGHCLNPAGWVNDPAKRLVALRMATMQIDAAAPWHGARYWYNQALEFPRILGSVDVGPRGEFDGASFEQRLSTDQYLREQKRRVQAACCFQALYLLNEGRDVARDAQYRGATSRSLGHRFSESESYGRPHLVLCPEAWDQLGPYEGDPVLQRGGSTLIGSRSGIVGTLP